MNTPDVGAHLRRATTLSTDSVLQSRRFVQLLAARFVSGLAVNALHYALIIAVVRETGSAFHSSLMVVTFAAPGVVTGFLAGIAADHVSRKLILIAAHLIRGAACIGFFAFADNVWMLYVFSVLFATVNPLAAPAEYAMLPGLVGKNRLTSGNAWFNLTSLAGQALGVGAAAPVLLILFGAEPVYVLGAVLYATAALLVIQMGRIPRAPRNYEPAMRGSPADIRTQVRQALDFLRSDRPSYMATVEMAVVATAVLVTISVMPAYVDDVIGISATGAVFIFAPAVIGMAAGLRFVTPLCHHLGKSVVVTAGFALLVAGCFLLAFIEPVTEVATRLIGSNGSLPVRPPAVAITAMVLAVPLGFAFTAVNVAARAVLHERTPAELQGRVFAMQSVLASMAAIAPVLAGGVLAELVGVRFVMIFIGVAAAAVRLYTGYSRDEAREAVPGPSV